MSLTTTQYIRKPLYVAAVRVTEANFDEVVAWCQGEVEQDVVPYEGPGKPYIRVRVHNPKNPRQTKAFVGDWLLYTERGYKVYTNKAFHSSFDEAGNGRWVHASVQILPGITITEALLWLKGQPENLLDQLREMIQSKKTFSSIAIQEHNAEQTS